MAGKGTDTGDSGPFTAAGAEHREAEVTMVGKRCHLVMDALEVHQPGVPELKLDPGRGVQPIQQVLG